MTKLNEIKKCKAGFLPNHTKLVKPYGTVARAIERPETLADNCEEQQWKNKNEVIIDNSNPLFYQPPLEGSKPVKRNLKNNAYNLEDFTIQEIFDL